MRKSMYVKCVIFTLVLLAGIGKSDCAVRAQDHTHAEDGLIWVEWTGETSLPGTAGNYVLTKDVTVSGRTNFNSGTYNICLNGHTIKLQDGVSDTIFYINGATVNLYDCTGEGVITGGKGAWSSDGLRCGGAFLVNSGSLTIYGGNMTGNTADMGGAVYSKSNLRISGGKICGNEGYGIAVEAGTFTMDGGTISENDLGIVLRSGNHTISGGEVSGNASSANAVGGIMVLSNATLNLSNAMIADNNGARAGGIWNGGTLTLSNVRIEGNTGGLFGGVGNIGTVKLKDRVVIDNNTGNGWGDNYVSLPQQTYIEESLEESDIHFAIAQVDIRAGIYEEIAGRLTAQYQSKNPGAGAYEYFHYDGDTYVQMWGSQTSASADDRQEVWLAVPTYVDSIEITGIETPIAQKELDINANCNTVGVRTRTPFVKYQAGGQWAGAVAGYKTVYTAVLELEPDMESGYLFRDTTQATINGNPAVVAYDSRRKTMTVQYSFPKTENDHGISTEKDNNAGIKPAEEGQMEEQIPVEEVGISENSGKIGIPSDGKGETEQEETGNETTGYEEESSKPGENTGSEDDRDNTPEVKQTKSEKKYVIHWVTAGTITVCAGYFLARFLMARKH